MFDKNLMTLEGMRAIMAALLVLAFLQAAAIAAQAIELSRAICLFWVGGAFADAVPHVCGFAAAFAFLQLIRFAQETMLDRYSSKAAGTLRAAVLARAFDESALLAQRVGSTHVTTVAADGIDDVQTYIRIIPPKMIGMVAITVPLLACEFILDWPSGIILAVMFPVIIFFMVLLGRQAKARAERQYRRYTLLTNRFMDTLRGLETIRAFGASDREAENAHKSSEELRFATVKTLRTATLSSAVLDFCATFGTAAVAIMLAFRLMDGSLDLFTGLTALILAPEYFNPIRSFATDYHASLDGKNSLSDVLAMLGSESDTVESRVANEIANGSSAPEGDESNQNPGETARETADRESSKAAIHVRPAPAGADGPAVEAGRTVEAIELQHVTFVYADGTAGIQDISLSAKAGERIAIVGKSGAGKSSLANVLAGFSKPTSGAILVNGSPVCGTPAGAPNALKASPNKMPCPNATDDPASRWMRHVRYIPQRPYVFRASLEDNIRFYRPDATRNEVLAAAEAVGLSDLIADLDDGIETLVGDGARGLSGGEAHRVALARVLVDSNAHVIVFDEPTAHLDVETERDLKAPMLKAMEGRLVFFATHRLHWIDDMDRVITLDSGKVVGSDRPAEVSS